MLKRFFLAFMLTVIATAAATIIVTPTTAMAFPHNPD
jgi:hypothetical protein